MNVVVSFRRGVSASSFYILSMKAWIELSCPYCLDNEFDGSSSGGGGGSNDYTVDNAIIQ